MFYLCKSRRLKGHFEHRGRSHFVRMFYSVSGAFSFCPNVRKMRTFSFAHISFNMIFYIDGFMGKWWERAVKGNTLPFHKTEGPKGALLGCSCEGMCCDPDATI
jgi:hypothetical protein